MNKYIIHIAASLALIFSLAAANAIFAYDTIGPACTEGQTTQKVSFVHVGDLHANFDLFEDKYSRIRAFLEQVRTENPYTIFTNAGDDHEKGSLAEQYSHGDAVTEATIAMQFDVRTIGNHDFAWGVEHLLAFSRDPHSLVLSSNTHYDGPDVQGLGSVDYGVLQVGCLRIGFFGLVGPSWNELDEPAYVDYLPSLHTTFNYVDVAQSIVDAHRGEVDLMVMVSHLGNDMDKTVAESVAGIDLVLGGHSHDLPTWDIINSTRVVLPDYYGDGVTRVDMEVDLATHLVSSFSCREKTVDELTEIDPIVHQAISAILTAYAPDAHKPVAYLEYLQDYKGMSAIAAKAGIELYAADAALLDPERADYYGSWSAGEVTTQDLIDGYFIERQRPNTPGINSLYMVEVSGLDLQLMRAQQSTWIYSGLSEPLAGSTYKVIIHKGAALNPSVFFTGVNFFSVAFLSETWEALAGYGADRTTACLSLDTDSPPPIPLCGWAGSYSVWTFSDPGTRFQADGGPGTLNYWDPNNTGWGTTLTSFGSTSTFSLPQLADGPDAGVMSFPKTSSNQGFVLTHNEPANGDFSSSGLVSNYTLVMDVLWPAASNGEWRALLQTSVDNSDDADWFVGNSALGNGIGILDYFSSLVTDQWYRIALVARTAATNGMLQFFVDGRFVGEVMVDDLEHRWALGPTALLFADNDNETEQGYVAGILFAGYAMTKSEVLGMGKASMYLQPLAVNGACGTANGGTFTSAPTSNLCSEGNHTTVSGTGPWTWTCHGINGGTSDSCSADLMTWAVSVSSGSGGTISPASALVNHGSTTTFTVTPTAGYTIYTVAGCGGSLNGSIYTTGVVNGNCTVTATFSEIAVSLPDGDLDGGGVSITDALRALRILAGLITPTSNDLAHGDVAPFVNGLPQPDGKIDIGDVVVILRKAVGLVSWQYEITNEN